MDIAPDIVCTDSSPNQAREGLCTNRQQVSDELELVLRRRARHTARNAAGAP
jgi:hypothetical protein